MQNRLVKIAFVIAASCLLLELLLRLAGMPPMKVMNVNILECYNQFTNYNTALGYYNNPGSYECYMLNPSDGSDTSYFYINHEPDGARSTHHKTGTFKTDSQMSMHMYGCSVTWGQGLSDSSTFPFKVQSQLPEIRVSNYGVGGFSMTQAYLLFKSHIENENVPDVAVFNYGFFHNSRNVISWSWWKAWQNMLLNIDDPEEFKSRYPEFKLPRAYLDQNGELSINYITSEDLMKGIRWRKWSALINLSVEFIRQRQDKELDELQTSVMVMQQIQQACLKNNIDLIVTGIFNDTRTLDLLNLFQEQNMSVVDISVDYKDPEYNLLPYDNHINGKGNLIMAKKFTNFHLSQQVNN